MSGSMQPSLNKEAMFSDDDVVQAPITTSPSIFQSTDIAVYLFRFESSQAAEVHSLYENKCVLNGNNSQACVIMQATDACPWY